MNNGYGWLWAEEYTPPFHIASDHDGDLGARFVDVNGDGLTDMVWNRDLKQPQIGAVINTGCGWEKDEDFKPPFPIAGSKGQDLGVRFVELDGDGAADVVVSYVDKHGRRGAKLGKLLVFQLMKHCQQR